MEDLAPHWHSDWAHANYRRTVETLARRLGLTRLCEIGGGRDPLFTPQEAAEAGISLTVNDISASELALAPEGFDTACFDICGDLSGTGAAPESFDLMFSRMVFEHLPDVPAAWRNIHTLLKPGGVGFAFFPTLYGWPFLLNHMIPESVSRAILRAVDPSRSDDGGDPKFPALYDWCYGDGKVLRPMLEQSGFREILVVPFWGHGYLRRFPVLRNLSDLVDVATAKARFAKATTYAFVLVRK
jgi:SAM-dependent methyltransferase